MRWACGLVAGLLLPAAATAATPPACAQADLPAGERLVHVPFETVDGRVYVAARVDGQGPFRFAVDTGAGGIARADASLVATLSLAPTGRASASDGVSTAAVDTVRLRSLALGGLVHDGIDVITRDYSRSAGGDAAFAGILARGFFADGLLVLDFRHRTLSFSRSRTLPADAPGALRYERPFRIPVVIGALRTNAQLDTGANVTLVLPRDVHAQVGGEAPGAVEQGRLTNGDIAMQRARLQGPLRIGEIVLADVEARVSAQYPEVLVGAHALRDAVVLIDQRTRTVAVCS